MSVTIKGRNGQFYELEDENGNTMVRSKEDIERLTKKLESRKEQFTENYNDKINKLDSEIAFNSEALSEIESYEEENGVPSNLPESTLQEMNEDKANENKDENSKKEKKAKEKKRG